MIGAAYFGGRGVTGPREVRICLNFKTRKMRRRERVLGTKIEQSHISHVEGESRTLSRRKKKARRRNILN